MTTGQIIVDEQIYRPSIQKYDRKKGSIRPNIPSYRNDAMMQMFPRAIKVPTLTYKWMCNVLVNVDVMHNIFFSS